MEVETSAQLIPMDVVVRALLVCDLHHSVRQNCKLRCACRTGGRQSTFALDEYVSPPSNAPANQRGDTLTPLGRLSRETVYERAKYFLSRVIPTAERWNVQLACHLEDPPAPQLRGIEMWNYPVLEGCERFANLVVSKLMLLKLSQDPPEPLPTITTILYRFHPSSLLLVAFAGLTNARI